MPQKHPSQSLYLMRWIFNAEQLKKSGIVSIPNLMIGLGIILLILFVGTVMFNKTQRNFMDTV